MQLGPRVEGGLDKVLKDKEELRCKEKLAEQQKKRILPIIPNNRGSLSKLSKMRKN